MHKKKTSYDLLNIRKKQKILHYRLSSVLEKRNIFNTYYALKLDLLVYIFTRFTAK